MADGAITLTVLGSGTSSGVPLVGCQCPVCTSTDPRDQRLRPSVLIQYDGRNVLVDTGPDFRLQALRVGLRRLDAILYTHGHADHIMGLDDVRPFNFHQRGSIPIYGFGETLCTLRQSFPYVFDGRVTESHVPKLDVTELDGLPFDLFGLRFTPIRLWHGRGTTHGFRFGRAAYLTDHSTIPEESMGLLTGLQVLFLDALRFTPHPTHCTVDDALRYVERLQPESAYLTHMSHDVPHARTEEELPSHVRLSYDGLQLAVERAN